MDQGQACVWLGVPLQLWSFSRRCSKSLLHFTRSGTATYHLGLSTMLITHLNCGAMRPFGGASFDGCTPGFVPAELSCHCLLLQRGDDLMLIDTGASRTESRKRSPDYLYA